MEENYLAKAILSAVIVIIAMCQSGCVSGIGAIGGTESLTIYKDLQLQLAEIENETERRRLK